MYRLPEYRVSVSGGFWLLLGWFAWACGWRPLLCVLAASAAHEAGHYLVLRHFRARVKALRIHILGAVMEADTSRLSYGQELMAVFAGPGANLFWAVVFSLWDAPRFSAFIGANIVLCVFNLLPVCPLDGGRGLYLFLSWRLGTAAGERVSALIGMLCGAALGAGLCLVPLLSGGSLWILPPAAGISAAAIHLWKKK